MREIHPKEIDLARLSELGVDTGAEMAEHLRWCARCRSVVADHRWLQEEISATLAVAVDAVPVPRPKWWAVQEVLLTRQRRQVAGWRGSAIASVVLTICLMLSASPVLGTSATMVHTLPPEAIIATAPDLVSGSATPTPAIFRQVQEITPLPTPVLALPPTPAQPEI